MSFVWQIMSHKTWWLEHLSAQLQHMLCNHTSLNVVPLLFEIFQRKAQIDFENQQRYDAMLCPKGLTQNSSFGVYQAKMTCWDSRIIHNADSQPITAKTQNNENPKIWTAFSFTGDFLMVSTFSPYEQDTKIY